MIKKIESASANRFLLLGIVLLIIGLIAVVQPLMVEQGLLWIIGILMIVGGCTQAIKGLGSGDASDKSFNLVVGALFAVMGIVVLVCWFSLLAFFTVIIGLLFLIQGFWTLIVAMSARQAQGHIAMLISGGLSLIIAILILAKWPSSSEYAVGILFGINLIFYGAALLALGTTLRNVPPVTVEGDAQPAETSTTAEEGASCDATKGSEGGS
ncbi:MAG: DUF308 domain-containing protein [Mariniblastus sp.]|nr:DUF308 domain-containing protein [Mariniblastus sp.]